MFFKEKAFLKFCMSAILSIAFFFMLSSCKQSDSYIYRERKRYTEIDSSLRLIHNLDTLRAMYDKYHISDDKIGRIAQIAG